MTGPQRPAEPAKADAGAGERDIADDVARETSRRLRLAVAAALAQAREGRFSDRSIRDIAAACRQADERP